MNASHACLFLAGVSAFRKLLDKNLGYRIFDFAHRVVNFLNLPDTLRHNMLDCSTSVLFYDHDYKAVYGIKQFIRTWKVCLESLYQSGADLHPLRGCYKEKKRYTVKSMRRILAELLSASVLRRRWWEMKHLLLI